jgi:hypothetical protein
MKDEYLFVRDEHGIPIVIRKKEFNPLKHKLIEKGETSHYEL